LIYRKAIKRPEVCVRYVACVPSGIAHFPPVSIVVQNLELFTDINRQFLLMARRVSEDAQHDSRLVVTNTCT